MRDVGVIENVGRADVHRDSLLMFCFGVPRKIERFLHVGINVEPPGQDAFVASEYGDASGCGKQAVSRGDGVRISRRGILRPVVEVAIAVVVESCCQVVVLVAICTEVRAEQNVTWHSQPEATPQLPHRGSCRLGKFTGIGENCFVA